LHHIKDPVKEGNMEDIFLWLSEVRQNKMLILILVLYVLITLCANFSGILTTKETSAAIGVTFSCVRSLIVLFISYIIGWEVLNNVETPIKLAVFTVAITGTLIYNNVWIVIPYFKNEN
jgi:hypothetical protein